MNTLSLLREKFTIREIGLDSQPVIALGNRLRIGLSDKKKSLIIRGHSMHITLRFGATLAKQISVISTMINDDDIADAFQWMDIWDKIAHPFEVKNTPDSWIAVYYNGKPIFEHNTRHMFFDVIEQCEHKNQHRDERYEKSIIMAQNAFRQSGKNVMIEEESHVGFILDEGPDESRFAVILRVPNQKATFITRISEAKTTNQKPYNHVCMNIAADYIEAINMCVRIGFMTNDIENGTIPKGSDADKKYKSFQQRLAQLTMTVNQAENKYTIRYRPEKPDFDAIQEKCVEVSI
jgi:hypothetical protein